MQDFSNLSEEELMRIVGEAPAANQPAKFDPSNLSEGELEAIARLPIEEDSGLMSRIVDSFTGNSRKTKEIESLPDWRGNMPEFSLSEGIPALKTSLGTMATGPDETAKIVKANFPDVQVRQDEKGNYIFKSGIDQKEYALKPGFRFSDIPRAVAGALMFAPAGRATSLLKASMATGATQAAIEASQAATGGEFNAGDVGAAAVLGGLGEAAGRIIGVAIPGVKRALQGKSFIPEEIAANVAPISAEVANADLRQLVDKAASESLSATKYKSQLAELAKINPDALEAATQLGIDLPSDVFSDNPQIRAIVGSARSIKASPAEAAWRESVTNAVNKADEVLNSIEASTESSVMSDKTFQALKSERDALKEQTKMAYGEVDNAIPKKTVISKPLEQGVPSQDVGMPNLRALLDQTIENRGGIKGLTSQEKSLVKMLDNDVVTYDRLLLEKQDLRRALRGKNTPYSNLDESLVQGLYDAVSKDQINAVKQLAGEDIADRLVSANLLYTKQKQLERTLVDAFGKDFSGSISSLLKSTVSGLKTGDIKPFNRLLSIVPENLQPEAVLSAITNAARPATGEFKGQFGITQFDNIWGQLQSRPALLDKVKQVIGNESFSVLDSLGKVARVINSARGEITQTGKSNQAILQEMRSTTFIEHLLGKIGQSVSAVAGGKIFGPVGFGLGLALPKILTGPKDRIGAAAKLFASQEFTNLVKQTVTRSVPSSGAINGFAASSAFSKFAQLAKLPSDIPSKVRWVKQALMSSQDMLLPQEAFSPDRVVAEVLPNGTVKTDSVTKFRIVQKQGGKYRVYSPTGEVSVHSTEGEALKAATKRLRQLTNSPLK